MTARKMVTGVVLEPDEVVLGGGNAKELKELPPKCRVGDNSNAFR
jgi:polyphosphate glucokinase